MTTTAEKMKPGDFSKLAENYSKYRPSYSKSVLSAILGIVGKPVSQIDFADVGAGTGIWTRMVAGQHCHSVMAVEPNAEMREQGRNGNQGLAIQWQAGSGENTGLADESVDLLSMASSFHWVDFEKGTKEFHRVLKKGGCFVALWNPRYIEDNPVLVDIENKIYALAPHIQRVSSGKSNFVEALSKKLLVSPHFEDLVYLEGRHSIPLSPKQYLGAWESVNDIRSQMGETLFNQFLDYVKQKTNHLSTIDSTYLTRAWVVRKK